MEAKATVGGRHLGALLPGGLLKDSLVKVLKGDEVTVAKQRELVNKQQEVAVVGVEVGCVGR